VAPFSLDETAKFFLILVALCEPRLRDCASVALPTAGEIVERLRGRLDLTRAAVNHHIDYLAIEKLRVKPPEPGRLDSKREALVAIALRYGIVRAAAKRGCPRSGSRRPRDQRSPAAAGDRRTRRSTGRTGTGRSRSRARPRR
jgi:hypothetical protein